MKRKVIKSAAILTTVSAACFFGYSLLPGTYNGVYDRKEVMQYAQNHKHEFDILKSKQLPSRQEQLDTLETTNFDVVVIGGGATGTGVALDAVTRGNLKVALLEKNDFAYGTSSRATKMAHGGVRYLEKAVMNLDPKEVNLVYECLRERKHFFQVAPHLVSALPILTPCYTAWDSFKMFVGLRLYDILSGNTARIGKSEWISKEQTLEINPWVKKANLYGSMKYYDAIFNDARMNLSLALTSALHGATVLNHCEVIQLLKDENTKKINGLIVKDTLTNKTYQMSAKVIVNATGAFSDVIRKMDDPTTHNIIKPSLGAHLILDKKYTPGGIGILYPKTTDGRVLYLLPWENATIAGTTDKGSDSITDKPPVQQEDVQFILKELKQQLEADFDEKKDVLSSWAGFRPLVSIPPIEKTYASNSQATTVKTKDNNVAQISRDHYIEVSDSNLITICGGKWTSFRKMAEDTIDVAIQISHLNPKFTHSKTKHTLLVGAHDLDPYVQDGVMLDHYNNLLRQQNEKLALDAETLAHLKHYYGDRSAKIMNMVLENTNLHSKLSPKYPFIEAEIIYHIEHEYACTALDVVTTRTNLMFLDKNVTMEVLPKIVQIMAKHLKWSRQRQEQELASAKQYIDNCTK